MPSFATLLIAATAALAAFAAPLGHTTSLSDSSSPLGNVGTSLGGLGSRQTDSFGDLSELTGPLGTIGGNAKRQTDSFGGLTDITNALGAVGGNTKRQGDSLSGLSQLTSPLGAIGGNRKRQGDAAGAAIKQIQKSTTDSVTNIGSHTPTPTKRGDRIRSLPEICLALKADLLVVLGNLNDIIAADAKVEVKVLVPILHRVGAILGQAVVEIKLLAGKSIEIVLFLGGSVISVAECANLLANVLIIVYSILAIVIQVAGSVKAEIIVSAVALVSGCVGELLVAVFVAVDGLLFALVPLIKTVISLSRVWVFTDILAILKV